MVRKQQRLEEGEAVRVSVRMPAAVHEAALQMSAEEQRSLNAQIVWCLQHCVARWKRGQRP